MDYLKAEKICKDHLTSIENLREFCKEHDIPYYSTIKIKNGQNSKPFPKLVFKILSIFEKKMKITITKNYGND